MRQTRFNDITLFFLNKITLAFIYSGVSTPQPPDICSRASSNIHVVVCILKTVDEGERVRNTIQAISFE